jgi:hypothetical protein
MTRGSLSRLGLNWFGRTISSAELALGPTDFILGSVLDKWTLVPLVDDRARVESVCFGCGPSNPCDACVASVIG